MKGECYMPTVTLNNGRGSTTGTINKNQVHTIYEINGVPADKIVVASLEFDDDVVTDCDGNPMAGIKLEYSGSISGGSGGWYRNSGMLYLKTSGSTNISVDVKIDDPSAVLTDGQNYTFNVAVVNAMEPFTPCDNDGRSQYADSTYIISNAPEYIGEASQKGEWGCYLQRSLINARPTIYWEHYNDFNYAVTFGVLLWNKDSVPVTVSLHARCMETEGNGVNRETAMTKVWKDRFNVVKTSDNSELPTSGSVTIPAYDSDHPEQSALWVTKYSVPAGPDKLFNGVLCLKLDYANGTSYNGSKVFCDTYVMTPGYENSIKPALKNLHLASCTSTEALRGGGDGCRLDCYVNETITITPTSSYNFLLTGKDIPTLQQNEKISITAYEKDVACSPMDNCFNYGVRYCISFQGFSSSQTIKGKILHSKYTNNSALLHKSYSGIYVAGFIQGMAPFGKLVMANDGEWTFCANVPKNTPVTLNLVVSGMSGMPLEVSFCN